MAQLKSQLVLSLIDRASQPMRKVNGALDRMREASAANAARMRAMRGRFVEAAGAGFLLYRALSSPINAATEFQASMGNVATLIDTTTESMTAMSAEVLAISKRTPVALEDLTSALYDIRSAGIDAGAAMGVLEQSSRLAVAGLGTTKEATDLVTSAINAFNLEGEEAERLYDVIFKTVRNGKTDISQLAQGFGAVAGTVANAGVEIDEYLASVAALTTTGLPAAQAHRQIRAAIAGLTRETKQSIAIFDQLGAENFTDLIEQSGGMVQAFQLIREATGDNDAAMINLLGSVEAYNAVIGLTGEQNDVYASTLDDMRNGADAVGEAFRKQAEQSKALRQVFTNNMQAIGISIGNALLPAINQMMAAITTAIGPLADIAQRFPQVTAAIVGLTAAVIGFRVAVIGFQYAGLFMKGAVLDIGIAALTAAQHIGRMTAAVVLGPAIAAFNALRAAIVGYTAAAAIAGHGTALKALGASLLGLLSPIRLVRTAMAALKVAVVGTGIGAILVGIALAGTWIYQNWKGITTAFEAFGEGFMAAIGPVRPALDPVINLIKRLVNWVKRITGPVDEAGESWAAFGTRAGEAVGAVVTAVVELPGKIIAILHEAADAIYAAITAPFRKAADYIRGVGDSIKSWMPSFGGGTRHPSPFDRNRGVDGARADGGPVRAGSNYLVGEEGPEIFTPNRSGFITPNEVFTQARSSGQVQASRAAPTINQSFTITLHAAAGATADEIVSKIERALGEGARAAVDGAFADGI